jgi:site-specific DNA-methyltransferase (adenine-specific)
MAFPYHSVGNCTMYHGDCLEILPHLGQVDSVITDPPYGISLTPPRGLTDAIQGDGREEAKALWRGMLERVLPLLTENSAHLFWSGWSETWTKELLAEFFTVKSCIVWAKNQFGIGYYTRPQHEFAWYCHHGKPPVPEQADSDLWEVAKIQAPVHSCEKPIALMKRAVLLCGGGRILDPFMGVGATGAACAKMGKAFTGIELEERYFQIACERIEQAYAQPDMFIAAPKPEQISMNILAEET